MKEKEQSMEKTLQEIKKELLKQKKELNSQIREIKKSINAESSKENKCILQKKQKKLIADLEKIDRLLIHHEIQALQSKIKIKEEKI